MQNASLNESSERIKSMTDLDILSIDAKIRKNFEEETSKLFEHKEKLQEIEETLKNENLRRRIRNSLEKARDDLKIYVNDLSTQKQLHFYIMETLSFIEQYKEILKIPVKVSFIGKLIKNDKEKSEIIESYIEAASKYVDIEFEKTKSQKVTCPNCLNKKEFDVIDGNTYICTKCYARQTVMKHNSSYTDIDRVNISSKYTYDRKVHFRDCINQYQGKQNSTIQQKIYDDLEIQFERHHLLKGGKDTCKEIKFKDVTKNHVLIFLKELGYSKHYENVHLIHYNFTGIKPDDISYLEEQLLDDFDVLTDLYDKRFKHINRKNFINTQYVLFQLLRRHRHPCKKEEFIILKTIDRKFFHDEICKDLFEELGWNHSPFY
jgi:ribosomal protein S24E